MANDNIYMDSWRVLSELLTETLPSLGQTGELCYQPTLALTRQLGWATPEFTGLAKLLADQLPDNLGPRQKNALIQTLYLSRGMVERKKVLYLPLACDNDEQFQDRMEALNRMGAEFIGRFDGEKLSEEQTKQIEQRLSLGYAFILPQFQEGRKSGQVAVYIKPIC